MCSRARDSMGRGAWRDSFGEASTRPCPGLGKRRCLGHDPVQRLVVMFDFEAVRPAEVDILWAVPYEVTALAETV